MARDLVDLSIRRETEKVGMSLRPAATHFYPLMNPPSAEGYKLELYGQLLNKFDTIVYEIKKPHCTRPFTIVVHPFEDHLALFHTLWNMDEFDLCAADRHFMMRLWHHLCPDQGPWDPASFDISIEEEHEPLVFRVSAPFYLASRLNAVCNDEEEDGINECIGRFCMLLKV